MKEIGKLDSKIIKLLSLSFAPDTPIYLGQSNIDHIRKKHPQDYLRYGNKISDIISAPDYVRKNPKDNSIEYVKEFQINNEFVKVAVRVSGKGTLYARSLYVLNRKRVNNFIDKGTLKKT